MKLFRKISQLTAWMVPTYKYHFLYKELLTYLDLRNDIKSAHKNYEHVLNRIKNKNGKIKVVFLIRENQKWTYQSLYDEFEKSNKFEPLVLVSILTLAAQGKDKTRNNLEENYEFFKSKGMNVDYAYKDGKYVDLKEFEPDIVFYDQSYDLPDVHSPAHISESALTFYSSYGYEIFDSPRAYMVGFHRFLYKFFVEHELNVERYGSYNKDNAKNCVAVGYPKLDAFLSDVKPCNLWKDKNKIKIIYAPHHSLEKNGLRVATFRQNGKFILELAKSHPETTWVFKPHPRFKHSVLRTKTMTQEEIDNYYDEWARIGTIYEQGDYINLFRTSDLMITDGCSFLAEYLPTQKPLIRLVNNKGVNLSKLGKLITKGFYEVYDNTQLKEIFEDLIVNKNDYKFDQRKDLAKEVLNHGKSSCSIIYNLILTILEAK